MRSALLAIALAAVPLGVSGHLAEAERFRPKPEFLYSSKMPYDPIIIPEQMKITTFVRTKCAHSYPGEATIIISVNEDKQWKFKQWKCVVNTQTWRTVSCDYDEIVLNPEDTLSVRMIDQRGYCRWGIRFYPISKVGER